MTTSVGQTLSILEKYPLKNDLQYFLNEKFTLNLQVIHLIRTFNVGSL